MYSNLNHKAMYAWFGKCGNIKNFKNLATFCLNTELINMGFYSNFISLEMEKRFTQWVVTVNSQIKNIFWK